MTKYIGNICGISTEPSFTRTSANAIYNLNSQHYFKGKNNWPGGTADWGGFKFAIGNLNSVITITDFTTSNTFYAYAKSWNSTPALCVMAGRAQGSGSQFYYSNSWWSSKTIINDNSTQANVYTNTTNNFLSQGFFDVPISGAFITCILDGTYPNGYIQYSGTFNNMNSIGSGGVTSSQATTANHVGLQAVGRGGELVTTTTTSNGGETLRYLGAISGTGNIESNNYKATDGNSSYRPGNGPYISFDPDSAYAHSSNSRSRVKLGRVLAQEPYLGGSYSASAAGFGCASDDQDGLAASPGIQISSGLTNARSNAGNSGVNEYSFTSPLELWIIPQDSWTFTYTA